MARISSNTSNIKKGTVWKRVAGIRSGEHVAHFSSVTVSLKSFNINHVRTIPLDITLCGESSRGRRVFVTLADTRSNVDYFLPEVARKQTWELDTSYWWGSPEHLSYYKAVWLWLFVLIWFDKYSYLEVQIGLLSCFQFFRPAMFTYQISVVGLLLRIGRGDHLGSVNPSPPSPGMLDGLDDLSPSKAGA